MFCAFPAILIVVARRLDAAVLRRDKRGYNYHMSKPPYAEILVRCYDVICAYYTGHFAWPNPSAGSQSRAAVLTDTTA